MQKCLIAIFLTISFPTLASADGMLPIRKGVYVDNSVPCKRAAMAYIQGYYGSSLSYGHGSCAINTVKAEAGGFRVKASCKDENNRREKWSGLYRVLNASTIKVNGTRKRWCAARVLDLW